MVGDVRALYEAILRALKFPLIDRKDWVLPISAAEKKD
jgi:hypothetical protein